MATKAEILDAISSMTVLELSELIKEMEETKDKSETSVEVAVRLIKELKPLCRGVHIMPLGWDKKVPAILEKAGI